MIRYFSAQEDGFPEGYYRDMIYCFIDYTSTVTFCTADSYGGNVSFDKPNYLKHRGVKFVLQPDGFYQWNDHKLTIYQLIEQILADLK